MNALINLHQMEPMVLSIHLQFLSCNWQYKMAHFLIRVNSGLIYSISHRPLLLLMMMVMMMSLLKELPFRMKYFNLRGDSHKTPFPLFLFLSLSHFLPHLFHNNVWALERVTVDVHLWLRNRPSCHSCSGASPEVMSWGWQQWSVGRHRMSKGDLNRHTIPI